MKCFFDYDIDNSYQDTDNRMQSITTETTFTAAAAIKIKGAKGLKKYIEEATKTIKGIRAVLENDLTQPNANVKEPSSSATSCRKNIHYRAQLCAMDHRTFVHNTTLCAPTSRLVGAEVDVNDCLSQLEKIRKMFVTNKQQKKTTIRQIREIIRANSAIETGGGVAETDVGVDGAMQELDYESPVTKSLKKLIEKTKKDHNTAASGLLIQAHSTIFIMNRYILAYQRAADTTVQEIINHAEKCRAFMEYSQDLALIEYCASAWWFETQKDPMDHSYYYVSAIADPRDEKLHFDASSLQHRYRRDLISSNNITILVHGAPTKLTPHPMVGMYKFDKELAQMILTEEAVQSFELEDGDIWKRNEEQECYLKRAHDQEMKRIQKEAGVIGWSVPWHQQSLEDDDAMMCMDE